MKKYYFVSYRIQIYNSTPYYGQELIDMTPLEFIIYWRDIGGAYSDRVILSSHEITEEEYKLYKEKLDDE